MKPRVILGIETSCDETAAALFVDGKAVADRTTTQSLHELYGGVVPELASRAHEKLLTPSVEGVLKDAGLGIGDVEGIAVTYGPGLAGALLVGLAFAKGLALARDIPFWGVNHLEGHLWSSGISGAEPQTPFLALIISGGHTLLVRVDGFGRYSRIGSTRDDAVGELFDKVGRMIGLPFPAGAAIDRMALERRGDATALPRTRIEGAPTEFSFSGLKTAALYYLKKNFTAAPAVGFDLPSEVRSALCAGLMRAVGETFRASLRSALDGESYRALVVAGGVSASQFLRAYFSEVADEYHIPLLIPQFRHCTDNGEMIAYAGYRMIQAGYSPSPLSLAVDPGASLFTSTT